MDTLRDGTVPCTFKTVGPQIIVGRPHCRRATSANSPTTARDKPRDTRRETADRSVVLTPISLGLGRLG